MGMQLYELLINDTANFISFTGSVDRQLKESLYRGMAEGQEYYQYSYSKFGFGIGGIGYRIDAWNQIIDKVEDEFRPYCYQRLGIEIGWRFVHDIKKYLTFFQKADEKYAPYIYKGLGIGIGWRFGYDADGCSRLIDKIDKKYWPYIYEGLEMGSLKREGLQPDHRVNRSERTSGGAICG
jgi:Na+-transporting NADH:ubiquinone oxidoreductase subunit NqrE